MNWRVENFKDISALRRNQFFSKANLDWTRDAMYGIDLHFEREWEIASNIVFLLVNKELLTNWLSHRKPAPDRPRLKRN